MTDISDQSANTGESSADHFPQSGRLAAVDYGTVRIGIAICDPDRILASPYEVYPASGPSKDAAYFKTLVKEERVSGFVVGLPIHCDGGESQKSRECRTFARWLFEQTGVPVRLFDERFSTSAAKQRLSGGGLTRGRKKQRLDAVAALVLLESFLESSRYHGAIPGQSIHDQTDGGDSLSDDDN
ncbi:Holliday junction resolvase RuvX [Stieleria varia]|nr:Holliday junction resolvase RuvX [Stieleria varia]